MLRWWVPSSRTSYRFQHPELPPKYLEEAASAGEACRDAVLADGTLTSSKAAAAVCRWLRAVQWLSLHVADGDSNTSVRFVWLLPPTKEFPQGCPSITLRRFEEEELALKHLLAAFTRNHALLCTEAKEKLKLLSKAASMFETLCNRAQKLQASSQDENSPPGLRPPAFQMMLKWTEALYQETVYQQAADSGSETLLARLAAGVASLYRDASTAAAAGGRSSEHYAMLHELQMVSFDCAKYLHLSRSLSEPNDIFACRHEMQRLMKLARSLRRKLHTQVLYNYDWMQSLSAEVDAILSDTPAKSIYKQLMIEPTLAALKVAELYPPRNSFNGTVDDLFFSFPHSSTAHTTSTDTDSELSFVPLPATITALTPIIKVAEETLLEIKGRVDSVTNMIDEFLWTTKAQSILSLDNGELPNALWSRIQHFQESGGFEVLEVGLQNVELISTECQRESVRLSAVFLSLCSPFNANRSGRKGRRAEALYRLFKQYCEKLDKSLDANRVVRRAIIKARTHRTLLELPRMSLEAALRRDSPYSVDDTRDELRRRVQQLLVERELLGNVCEEVSRRAKDCVAAAMKVLQKMLLNQSASSGGSGRSCALPDAAIISLADVEKVQAQLDRAATCLHQAKTSWEGEVEKTISPRRMARIRLLEDLEETTAALIIAAKDIDDGVQFFTSLLQYFERLGECLENAVAAAEPEAATE